MWLPLEGAIIPIVVQPLETPDGPPERGGYFSGSAGNAPGAVGRSIRDKGRAPEGVDNEVDTVKGHRHVIV